MDKKIANQVVQVVRGREALNFLSDLEAHDLISSLEYHRLAGWVFSRNKEWLSGDLKRWVETAWRWQLLWNQLQLEELHKIGRHCACEGLSPVVLKGFAMIGSVFPDIASRFASDIDLWVPPKQVDAVQGLLVAAGYRCLTYPSWEGNQHKSVYSRWTKEGIEIQIEIHEALYPPSFKSDVKWMTEGHSVEGLYQLRPADHLFHLCIHYVYQHNLERLYWLVDVNEYLKAKGQEVDWLRFQWLVKHFGMQNVMSAVSKSLKVVFENTEFGELKYHNILIQQLIDENFLVNPRKSVLRYQAIKHLKNTNLLEAFRYDLGWIRARLKLGRENL